MPPVRLQPPELLTMFAVPFAMARYPAHEQLNPRLKAVIFELETQAATNPHPLTPRNAASIGSLSPISAKLF